MSRCENQSFLVEIFATRILALGEFWLKIRDEGPDLNLVDS